ncbi:hypothetical protein CKO45_20655 [Paracraurococcus ruber]|uniref:Uncharacterized protein n=1 Tax=Paracraurococcus ruber TaxID=77675 RepID=A0ABS1D1Y7_9PROT|nr:hypothetical protein [Paracraurococcus ruber]
MGRRRASAMPGPPIRRGPDQPRNDRPAATLLPGRGLPARPDGVILCGAFPGFSSSQPAWP